MEGKMKKALGVLILMLIVAGLLVAGGGRGRDSSLERVDFLLNWTITGDHAPYYVALEKGWYADAGLDVNVIVGQGSGYAVQAVEIGRVDLAIADAPVPITMRERGANVKIIGVIFDKHPNSSFFWNNSGIRNPQDLAGRSVAVPATDGHKVMWPAFARMIGIDEDSVHFINIDPAAKVSALASRNADVVFELFTALPFMQAAIPREDLGHFIWSDYGFDIYAHSYITNDDTIRQRPEMLRTFLDVTYRAWEYTLNNPEEAIEILSRYHPINRVEYLANLNVVMEFFKTDRYRNNGIGFIDPERIRMTYDLVNLYQAPLSFPVTDVYDTRFLPSPMYRFNF